MLGIVSSAVRGIVARTNVGVTSSLLSKQLPVIEKAQQRLFGALSPITNHWSHVTGIKQKAILGQADTGPVPPTLSPIKVPARTVIKFSLKKGKRKSVKAVVSRFYRLHWGAWIRTIAGRNTHRWQKSKRQKIRASKHVFCNATQSTLLDIMVTKYWKRPHHYVDDPYTPYNKREEFFASRRKPLPLPLHIKE